MLHRFPLGLMKIIAALAALYALAAWVGFAGSDDSGVLLGVVRLFIFLTVGLVTLLYRTRRDHPREMLGEQAERQESFGDWIGHPVDTSTGQIRGSIAATEILLPIAAVAVGMVLFAVTIHFAGRA